MNTTVKTPSRENLYWLSKVRNSNYYLLILSLLSGLLFWLGWPVLPFAPLLFFVFVPLLAIEEATSRPEIQKSGRKFFWYTYLTFLIWNVTTTWWVSNSTIIGGIFAMLANALLMYIPMALFRFTKKRTGTGFGYFSFVLYWLTFEYIHLNWDLSWPWLTIGNGFAMYPEWVQWYEWTGVFGGALWILLANIAFYFALFHQDAIFKGMFRWRSIIYTFLWVLIPIVFSYYMYNNYEEKGEPHEIVVLQPNIDPFTEKFIDSEDFIPFDEQVSRFINLSEQQLTPKTDYLLWPETAIDNQFEEGMLSHYPIIQRIKKFVGQYPNLSLLTGLTTYTLYKDAEKAPPTARFRETVGYYDVYNTAYFISDAGTDTTYHKSKLVPGVEIMPYPQVFSVLSETIFNLGGTAGGYGRQEERTVFFDVDKIAVAPSICYESVYGDYMAEFIRNGANYIFIITNDGWWGNTAGHKQHFHYASLRAIENRRSIARCANTGISGFFNQRGDILQRTNYWEQDVIRAEINGNEELTFYSIYGDYIARTAAWLAGFVFLAAIVKRRILR